ncbi:beta-lactamase family protein [Bacillus sp. DX1.1]|uniref:beta-lactamase family protein n=1 Tax=unclassified Bacillus (in: firmicutes) TaxID=185979 RepID=UPI00257093E1|nr:MULTISPECIES: beta-lactamase family protein [unclassified Bacillus (in: firmicutes)]MDM5155308.1 beta-lactamase family protein [Bacillus sp. DX1.1]WJE84099.1 beta-lactamase family protein [Bacillus sp. DX3.1]
MGVTSVEAAHQNLLGPNNPKEVETFIDQIVSEGMDQQHVPGAVFVVVKDGKVVLQKGYGYADKEKQTPVDATNTVFRLASVSKVFTATAVMQLVEQGKIDLHTDITNYLGGLTYKNNFSEPVTMENLLTHTTGFDYVDPRPDDIHENINQYTRLQDYVEKNMPAVVRKPGDSFTYDNFASMLQGYIVQNTSGMPFYKYMAANIFNPLQMQNSSFVMTPFIEKKLATGYKENGEAIPFYEIKPTDMPQGSMFSTGSDVANFMIAQLNDGKRNDKQILKKESVQEMHKTRYAVHPKYPNMAYGFEFFSPQNHNGQYVFGKGGDIPGFSSLMWLIPEQKTGVFVVYNTNSSQFRDQLFKKFMNHYFPDSSPKPEVLNPSKEELKKFEGYYRDLRIKNVITRVEASEGKLIVSDKFNGKQKLKQLDPLLFQDETGQYMAFKLNKDGTIKEMIYWNSSSTALKLSEPKRFQDVGTDNAYAPYIDSLQLMDILQAKEGESFVPEDTMTRGEFASWLSNTLYFTPPSKNPAVFPDVEGHPYAAHIQKLYELGVLREKEGENFSPDREITRQEAAWLAWSYIKTVQLPPPTQEVTLKGETDDWAIEAVKNIVAYHFTGPEVVYNQDGSADYLSKQQIKRQEAAALLYYVMLCS